ncbi:MAG TPA: 2-dehydro-3-deoxygalactonokinase [Clostridiaceae bacterium]|nr:2-dehydro-3-deoxygalactonokinase [Clostridiaceae bacterium]
MYILYYDSGTSHTRAYLLKDDICLDTLFISVGTKDAATSGSNDVLVRSLKEGMDAILRKNEVPEDAVSDIYMSGMVTNPFGICEVQHLTVPIDAQAMSDGIHTYEEKTYFRRRIQLIRGAKTVPPKEGLTLENIHLMGNARGEEIEVIGMVAKGIIRKDRKTVMVSPGSHTHMCLVEGGFLTDIASHFTGELHHALLQDTILGGETTKADIDIDAEKLRYGYHLLKTYGLTRALYIVHSTKVFDVATDEMRSMMLSGIITGSVIENLQSRLETAWKDVEHICIIGGPRYVEAYRILIEEMVPGVSVDIVIPKAEESLALMGFQELLRVRSRKNGIAVTQMVR